MSTEHSLSPSNFPETRWSLIAKSSEPEALEELCEIYWRPVYLFLRRSGRSPEDAEDLTQSFFAKMLESEGLENARENKGRLRSFLLGALKRHLDAERRFDHRLKRGGGAPHLPLATSEMDFEDAEHQYAAQPSDDLSPDRIFDQRWATELLERAQRRLRKDYEAAHKSLEFDLLKSAIMTTGDIDNPHVAKKLKVKEASVRVLVHRLRRNFKAAFKDEIAGTVMKRTDVEEEFLRLLEVFS